MNPSDLFNLKGKTALVTGCSRGIGAAMAEGLAAAGANIIGLSRSMSNDSPVSENIKSSGSTFTGHAVDFADRKGLYAVLEQLRDQQIDILVNNAGTIYRQPAAEHPDEEWDKVIATNLDAQFIITREVGKQMLQRGKGKIVFTCSLLSFQGGINVPGYAASKGAVASLVKAFANEWASKGVNVNGIAPGYISTDNTEALRNDPVRSKSILDRIPAARWGEPSDLVGPLIFLASDASDYVHGTILTVDGGWMGR
jgi:2-dehydro-3-deoxy-D-gluconate 5-dehydrogenase